MAVPEGEESERRIMGGGQPSVCSQETQHAGENPLEIVSLDSGAEISSRESDANADAAKERFTEDVGHAGPSSQRGESSGELGLRIADEGSSRLNESSGAERARTEEDSETGNIHRNKDDLSLRGIDDASETVGDQNRPSFDTVAHFPSPDKVRDSHVIEVPVRDRAKVDELDSYKSFPVTRTVSNFSVESAPGDQCRICQQHTEEPLMELGCQCRGELAKAHRSCIDHWFGNKGTNKCEVCQHVATNVPIPASQPTPHFWVWRVGGPYSSTTPRRAGGVGPLRLNPLPMRPVLLMTLRRHPTIMLLWLLLFAFMAYLFVDVTDSASIGYAAMPIGFLFGVLVVLGLGTAARLVLECWHERVIRRNIRRMEEEPNFEDFPTAEQSTITILTEPVEGQPTLDSTPQPANVQDTAGASQVATSASNMARP